MLSFLRPRQCELSSLQTVEFDFSERARQSYELVLKKTRNTFPVTPLIFNKKQEHQHKPTLLSNNLNYSKYTILLFLLQPDFPLLQEPLQQQELPLQLLLPQPVLLLLLPL